AAAIEPWRLKTHDHASILDNLKELGLSALELRIPWQIYAGLGTEREDRAIVDLFAFIEACHARHFALLVHLGPLSDVVDGGGLPRAMAIREIGAQGPGGEALIVPRSPHPFVQPSLASTRFLDAATAWLESAADALTPFTHPRGAIVAIVLQTQPDLLGRRGAYDSDYHPDALTRYRPWLQERYGDALPPNYPVASPTEANPPRHFDATSMDEILWHLDWLAFKESLVVSALERFTAVLRGHGLDDVVVLHRQPAGAAAAGADAPLGGVAHHVDGAGVTFSELRPDFSRRRVQVERLAGASPLPLVLQQPWGATAHWVPPTVAQQETLLLTSLMYGAQGLILDGLLGVDERVGAPLDAAGRPRRSPEFEATKRLLASLADLGLHRRPRPVEVGLIEPRPLARLAQLSSMLEPISPGVLALVGLDVERLGDPTRPGAEALEITTATREAIARTLDAAQLPFVRIDGEDPTALARLSTLILPWTPDVEDLLQTALERPLANFVDAGGQLLVVGPTTPAWLPPHERYESAKEATDALQAKGGASATLGIACRDATDPPLPFTERRGDESGGERVLFIANPKDAPIRGRIAQGKSKPGSEGKNRETAVWRLWDALSGIPVDTEDIDVPASSVRILRCRHQATPKARTPETH
ncbi:MAG: beta-galactosidase, partial [Deltaproteobacteria bacterium]|nr:beta-galactosidase [Deltaproteobacteria bacterium]